ncbi:Uncharacterised protein [Mycobacteroides abscessus subsp. bolletii]|nr:Uncharacterised protein [Mycobacteroides abscessus subsp. bolletii]
MHAVAIGLVDPPQRQHRDDGGDDRAYHRRELEKCWAGGESGVDMGGKAQALGRRSTELGEDSNDLRAQVGIFKSRAQWGAPFVIQPFEVSVGALVRGRDDNLSAASQFRAFHGSDNHVAVSDVNTLRVHPHKQALKRCLMTTWWRGAKYHQVVWS